MARRRIGISCNLMPAADRQFYKGKALHYGEASMAHAVERAGGLPLLLPVPLHPALAGELVAGLDGLILSGGADVSPGAYGEEALDPAWAGQPERDAFELALARAALDGGTRVLGVCRGLQLLNVALGGSLWQDLHTLRPDTAVHRSQEEYDRLGHDIDVVPGTPLSALLGAGRRRVNSVHHQGVKRLAPGVDAWATSADDGVVEALGCRSLPHLVAVQWHPEWMADDAGSRALFEWLVAGPE